MLPSLPAVVMDRSETATPRYQSTKFLKTTTDAICFNGPAYTRENSGEDIASQVNLEYEDSQLTPRSKDSSLYYEMSGDKILIIFNHFKYKKTRHHRKSVPKTRVGTYEDVKKLESTFRQLGFMVVTHDDWKYKEITNYLNDVCKMDHSNTSCVAVAVFAFKKHRLGFIKTGPHEAWNGFDFALPDKLHDMAAVCKMDHSNTSCVAVAVMTHGKGSRLSAADRKYPVADITDTLRTAPSLAGKPKLFFIQACRTGHTQPKPRKKDEVVSTSNADCLLLYSTYEDHYSYRDEDGSWMMQALCDVIDAHHHSMNLVQMVTLVNKTVARINSDYGKQMPVTEFNLKKFLKFQSVEKRRSL